MTTKLLTEILEMSVAERIQLVEDVWDSIAAIPEAIELTTSQQGELDRRLAEYRRSNEPGLPWNEVKARILARQ